MASNEKNLCNALREEWRLLTTLVNNAAQILRKVLNHIRAMVNRIVNTYFATIASTMRDLRDIVSAYLGLAAIDKAMARQEFCRMLYSCKPAMDLIMRNFAPDFYTWLYDETKTQTPDLSRWGIPSITFRSRYEVFEYTACRLSLNSLYDSFVDTLINKFTDFIEKYKKYFTVDWWLENSMPGRVLMRFIKDYEDFFREYIQKYLEMLEPYLDCAFNMCDFATSTQNFFDDFRAKYKIGINNAPNPIERWVVYVDDITSDLSSTMASIQSDVEGVVPADMKTEQIPEDDAETTPFTNSEKDKIQSNSEAMVTSKNVSKKYIPYKRDIETKKTPNSIMLA